MNPNLNRFLTYVQIDTQSDNTSSSTPSTAKQLNLTRKLQEELGEIIVVMPPETEQNQIASYLVNKCKTITSAIEKKQQQLSTLEEYRKSLIYEYVTGKKEVAYA